MKNILDNMPLQATIKTVQLGSRPVLETEKNLKLYRETLGDIKRHELLPALKSAILKMHKDYITKCLIKYAEECTADFDAVYQAFVAYTSEETEENSAIYNNMIEICASDLENYFDSKIWKDRLLGVGLHKFNKDDIIANGRYSFTDEEVSALVSYQSYMSTVTNLVRNYEMIYGNNESSASIINRTIRDNLQTWAANRSKAFAILGDNAINRETNFSGNEVLFSEAYSELALQDNIDEYNRLVDECNARLDLLSKLWNSRAPKRYTLERLKNQVIFGTPSLSIKVYECDEDYYEDSNPYLTEGLSEMRKLALELSTYDTDASEISVQRRYLSTLNLHLGLEKGTLEKAWEKYCDGLYPNEKTKAARKKKIAEAKKLEHLPLDVLLAGCNLNLVNYLSIFERLNRNVTDTFDEYTNYIADLKQKGRQLRESKEYAPISNFYATIFSFWRFCLVVAKAFCKDGGFAATLGSLTDVCNRGRLQQKKIENYLSKSPYDSLKRIPLYFGNSSCFGGFSTTKIDEYRTLLIRDTSGHNPRKGYHLLVWQPKKLLPGKVSVPYTDKSNWMAMRYQQIGSAPKFFGKNAFALKDMAEHFQSSNADYILDSKSMYKPFVVSKELYDIARTEYRCDKLMIKAYSNGMKDMNPELFSKALPLYIKACIEFLHCYGSTHNIDWNPDPYSYESIMDFYNECEKVYYHISWDKIDFAKIREQVACGQAYLFEIETWSNSNFTNLFCDFFSDENLQKNMDIQLCGGGKISYREMITQPTVTHPKDSVLLNRDFKDEEGKTHRIPNHVYFELYRYYNNQLKKDLSEEAKMWQSKIELRTHSAKQDISKYRRFEKDQYLLTLAFTMGANNNSTDYIGQTIRDRIRSGEYDYNYMCVSRSREHLLEYRITKSNGTLISEGNLDYIYNRNHMEFFNDLQSDIAANRINEYYGRRRVANFYDNYIKDACSALLKLATDNNCLLCIENMTGNSRLFPKTHYSDLLKAIQAKASSYVQEGVKNGNLNASQYADAEYNDYHNGIIFQTTSLECDPATGFIAPKLELTSQEQRMNFFHRISSVEYISEENEYAFTIDIDNRNVEIFTHGMRGTFDPTAAVTEVVTRYGIAPEMVTIDNFMDIVNKDTAASASLANAIRLTMSCYNMTCFVACTKDKYGVFADENDEYPHELSQLRLYHLTKKMASMIAKLRSGETKKINISNEDYLTNFFRA